MKHYNHGYKTQALSKIENLDFLDYDIKDDFFIQVGFDDEKQQWYISQFGKGYQLNCEDEKVCDISFELCCKIDSFIEGVEVEELESNNIDAYFDEINQLDRDYNNSRF